MEIIMTRIIHFMLSATTATILGVGIAAGTLPAYATKKYDESNLRGT